MEGVPCAKVEGISESFTSLARLSVVNCGLKSLEGLPKLPKLTTVSSWVSVMVLTKGCGFSL